MAVAALLQRGVDAPVEARRRSIRSARAVICRHWLFAASVVVAVGLRVAVSLAYWPGLEFMWDSYDYLIVAHQLVPGTFHPAGYPLFLALLSLTGQLGVVVIVQHIMGIALGALVYLLALRLGVRRWLAAIAALAILIDGYQLDIEQFILAETLTDVLVLGGLAVLLWSEQVSARRGAVVGLLLAAAALTRTAILPVLAVPALYLLLGGGRWRAVLAYGVVAATILVGYGGWYATAHGHFGYSDFTGRFLYGRVAPFATCHYALPPDAARLCPAQPVAKRSHYTDFYEWDPRSPLNRRGLGNDYQRAALGERFAIDVIEHQPLDYVESVLGDVWHYFTPGRWMTVGAVDMPRWRLPPPRINANHVSLANLSFNGHRIADSTHPSLMGPLRTYQSIFYTPGPALLACLLGAIAAGLGLARTRATRRQARWAVLALAASSIIVLISPSLSDGFSYRYELPVLVLLPPAGALAADLGLDALARRRYRRR